MFRSILVPLDGSAFSETALPHALALAERSGGSVTLAHAASSSEDVPWLEQLAERVRGAGPEVELHTAVLRGDPVPALHQFVVEQSVDQIIMTTHGLGGVTRAWMGSVADGLVRRTPAPILLLRSQDDEPSADLASRPRPARILVALDGSEPSEAIVPWAEELARLNRASLVLVGVVPAEEGFAGYLPPTGALDREMSAAAREMEGYLEGLAERLRAGGASVGVRVVTGPPPAEGILATREKAGAELMAFATSGRGGVARLLVGSVADRLIREGACPVLVFRARQHG